jgi:hypothetical protein
MALAISSGSAALLLAYCVTGLSLLTINNGMAGRGTLGRVVGTTAHAQVTVSMNDLTPIPSLPVRARTEPWQSASALETPSSDDPLGKREELRELRRRAARAFMVMSVLKGSSTQVE